MRGAGAVLGGVLWVVGGFVWRLAGGMAVIKISVLAFLVTWRHNSVVNLIKE